MGACHSRPSAAADNKKKPPAGPAAASTSAAALKNGHAKSKDGCKMASTPSPASNGSSNSNYHSPSTNEKSRQEHIRSPSQDISIGSNFSSTSLRGREESDEDLFGDDYDDDKSSGSSSGPLISSASKDSRRRAAAASEAAVKHNNGANNSNIVSNSFSPSVTSTSSHQHRRRKSRQLDHSDSRVGLHEIISGDLKNPNLVRIEVPLGKPIEEVYEGVHDGPVLGSGISGIVRLVKHKKTQVSYAVKCLDLALIDSEEGLKQLKEEIYIMCQLVSFRCKREYLTQTHTILLTHPLIYVYAFMKKGPSQHCPS